jgi:glycerol-3-phosphate dehydrogenase (NAD(P)+)
MKTCVLGTGAFGVGLALSLYENNHEVTMWTKFEDEKEYLVQHRKSPTLPNVSIEENITFTTNLKDAVEGKDFIIIVVPAGAVRGVVDELKNYIKENQHICIASKGIEQDTCKFVYDVVKEYIDTDKIAVISGPTFAIDVANKVPVGLSLASTNEETINITKQALENKHIKLRETSDILGVEVCGSIKNVVAIASGILSGMNLPISTQAMLITESANDIKELIDALGGDKKTILSFAGFGDILLTCTSEKSRNFTLGNLIGSKAPKREITNYIKTNTIEGLYTLTSISKLIEEKNICMPIVNLLNDIIYNDKPVEDLLVFLIEK